MPYELRPYQRGAVDASVRFLQGPYRGPGLFSASVGRKQIYPTTFATIGSVKGHPDAFRPFRFILIDECHGVNSKGGMYCDFLKALGNPRVLGLTATPYRLVTDG